MAKLMTITIETNSLLVLQARSSGRMWCPRCGYDSELLKVMPRCSQSSAGWAALGQWIESGEVHYQQAADGSTLICLNSLLKFIHDRLKSRGHSLRAVNTKMEEI